VNLWLSATDALEQFMYNSSITVLNYPPDCVQSKSHSPGVFIQPAFLSSIVIVDRFFLADQSGVESVLHGHSLCGYMVVKKQMALEYKLLTNTLEEIVA
jgi:hypothetical protein